MFRPNWSVCTLCGEEGFVVVKKGFCGPCNHKQKAALKKAALIYFVVINL